MRILIVDDDKQICQSLTELLSKKKFICDVAFSAVDAILKIEKNDYDFAIIDRMLKHERIDGLDLLRRIRAGHQKDLPVIILSGLGSLHDRIEGLNSGADSYLSKPFSKKELIAIIYAQLRKKSSGNEKINILEYKTISLDVKESEVKSQGKMIKLTPIEFRMLRYFLVNPRRIIQRKEIGEHVWSAHQEVSSNTLNVHLNSLRQKLGQKIVATIWGRGFRLLD